MLFNTDKQTLEDLNIYSKQGTDSVCSLFNRTFTSNGSKLLEEMFRQPLSDAVAINQRSEIIRYLSVARVAFPFGAELFDQAEQYLANTDGRTRLSAEQSSLEKKLTSLVVTDAGHQLIVNGVAALIRIIQELHDLLKDTLSLPGNPLKHDAETLAIKSLLTTAPMSGLLEKNPKHKLSRERLASCDVLFRFRHRDLVNQVLLYIYRLDVYIAVANTANGLHFVFPKALPQEEHKIKVEGFFHPRLKNAVPNTLTIDPGSNVVFLTGANMAGKSTFMKSLGIVMYLAHMGFPVPAKQMEFAVMDGIYTTINLPDNLGAGASHFYAEVLRIKKIAKELSTGKNIFVIFDELFRGTNVKDAYEATIAITTAFARKRNSVFVISTHIIEAGEALKERANISFKYLPTRMQGNVPEYTYTLETGITGDRHGMIIVNNEGILELLRERKDGAAARSFIADRQTLEDLNLLGKYKQHSIFNLFHVVKTTGGGKLLDAMFQTPLRDPIEINRRSAIFKYFQAECLVLPFEDEQFSAVENYLGGHTANNYPATVINLAGKKLLALVVRDEEYPNIQSGLQHTITLLNYCKTFIGGLTAKAKQANPLYDQLLTVSSILNDPRLAGLTASQTGASSQNLLQVAKYDHLLRHTMRPALQTVMGTLYLLDVYIAVANLAKEKNFSYAQALPKERNQLSATALRHPNMDKAVANPVSFHQENNMIFLTGANMAGKSTFMKSLGINIYLAHMGFPVAAGEMIFSVKDGIYSSINVPDNLNLGYSHFYAEVLRVKKVAEEVSSGKDLVVLFDELFKGTNVKDAYDATLAVTAAFNAYPNCQFIISTHIIEAGEVLKQQNNTQMLYLPTIMDGNIPTYPYKLQPGISSDRHGMMIIENEGILKLLKAE